MPADYNGTGTAIESVFRPATGQWFSYSNGVGSVSPVIFPVNSEPEPGDYDGVGKAEMAVYNPTNSQWLVVTPGTTTTHVVATIGGPTDIPVPGQYDNIALAASNKPEVTEAAVWRPSTGQYFIHGPSGNRMVQFAIGDIPEPGDYDGIGETEPAVYRPSTGQLLVMGPNDSTPRVITTFGGTTDIPLLSPYPYRALGGTSGISGASIRSGSSGSGSGGLITFDFGGTSQGMTKSSTLGSVSTSSSGQGSTPAPAVAPTSVTPTRPRQALIAKEKARALLEKTKEKKVEAEHVKAKSSLIDKALHALAGTIKRKGQGSPRA